MLLWPFSLVYRLAISLRRWAYRRGWLSCQTLPVAVIVVGNITVGGSGKTPLVLCLAAELAKRGWRPGLISRGYGGTTKGPHAVALEDDPALVGDEALLLAASGFPVYLARDRIAAARSLLAAHPRCNVLIADDGLQHYRLARLLEIIVIDAARRFGNEQLLPAGPLREPLTRLTGDSLLVWHGEAKEKLYTMRLLGDTFYQLQNPAHKVKAQQLNNSVIHAIAGIGHPERFFQQLRELGLVPICHPFPDHHRFVRHDFPDQGLILLTEKDAVKCRAFADQRFWVLPVVVQVTPALLRVIEEKLHGYQATGNLSVPGH